MGGWVFPLQTGGEQSDAQWNRFLFHSIQVDTSAQLPLRFRGLKDLLHARIVGTEGFHQSLFDPLLAIERFCVRGTE